MLETVGGWGLVLGHGSGQGEANGGGGEETYAIL